MKLTIAIPTYQRNSELLRCINSIDFISDEIEILVSDNNPENDVSKDLPSHIRYYRNAVNIGIMSNMLQLIEKSRGLFIFFITDDDFFLPGSIDKILKFIKELPENINAFKVGLITHLIKSHEVFHNDYLIKKADSIEDKQRCIFQSSHIFSGSCLRRDAIPLSEFAENHEKFYYTTSVLFGYNIGTLEYLQDLLIIHTWQNEVYWDFAAPGSTDLDINWNKMCDYLSDYHQNFSFKNHKKVLRSIKKEKIKGNKKIFRILNMLLKYFGFRVIRI